MTVRSKRGPQGGEAGDRYPPPPLLSLSPSYRALAGETGLICPWQYGPLEGIISGTRDHGKGRAADGLTDGAIARWERPRGKSLPLAVHCL